MDRRAQIERVAARHWVMKYASPLTDASHLRKQIVFLMGAGGSGKGYVAYRWLKYMPGSGGGGASRSDVEQSEGTTKSPNERALSNLNFQKAVEYLRTKGFDIEVAGDQASAARIPFRLFSYDDRGGTKAIPQSEWKHALPPEVLSRVEGLSELIFSAPKNEIPSFWRQVNPDIFKEEIPGYLPTQPGYVHEMSSEMGKAYLEAALETGDPIFVDQTGANARKVEEQIRTAQAYGYRVSLVLVWVPLTVNQIRNATRSRNVDPDEVTRQWKLISANFARLRGSADKSTVVDNRNDSRDEALYNAKKDHVNRFVSRNTVYQNLYALVEDNAPKELQWYPWVGPKD